MYLIGMLVLLFLANIAMLLGLTNWPQRTRENFAAELVKRENFSDNIAPYDGMQKSVQGPKTVNEHMDNIAPYDGLMWGGGSSRQGVAYKSGSNPKTGNEYMDNIAPNTDLMWGGGDSHQGVSSKVGSNAKTGIEYFTDTLSLPSFATPSMGAYDGLNTGANLPAASGGWRATAPNEPLSGPPVEIGLDNLSYFKNNQCKPECCSSTLSCSGGCVCTTPDQRSFINRRGGNRNSGDF